MVKEDEGNFYLGSNRFAVTPAPLPWALVDEVPQVEAATQINDQEVLLSVGENGFMEDGISATETFFDVFDFPMVTGDGAEALSTPLTILLTPALADRLFQGQDPIGRTVSYDYYSTHHDLTVAGVIAPPPPNSHIQFDFVVPITLEANHTSSVQEDRWGNNSWYTYAVLKAGSDPEAFASAVEALGHRRLSELDWYRENGRRTTYFPQALTDIHLRSHINFEISPNGDIRYVWLFALIALAILFTAAVNYTNLATARAATRAREIGVRKASGAHPGQLVGQFLAESVVMAWVAVLLSFAMVAAALPWFSALIDRSIPFGYLLGRDAVLTAMGTATVVGLLSGVYPALVLSRYRPAVILKGRVVHKQGGALRNGLVIAQFAVSVVLVFGTLVVGRQIRYMGTADTGVDRDQVLALRVRDRSLGSQWEVIRAELRAVPGVRGATISGHLPTSIGSQNGVDEWTGREEGQEASIYTTSVGYGFEELLNLELVEGRGFSPEHNDEGTGLLINESTRRALGWETAVGKEIGLGGRGTQVVGVLKDFHFHSFRQEIAPLALSLDLDSFSRILVKLSPERVPETIAGVRAVMEQFSPSFPFEYEFLDDAYNEMYKADRRLASIFASFTIVALIIACLGLFGLAAFMVQVRAKEIGVRKVLGAQPIQITLLMMRDLAQPVALAFLIGGPLAWFAMRRWLADFAYRIEPGLAVAVATAAAILIVAGLTIGWQSWRASTADPVRALRSE